MKISSRLHFNRSALYLIGLSALIFAVYWPGVTGGFFFDDSANILQTPELQVSRFTLDALLDIWGSGRAGPLGRPVSLLTFAVNHHFTGFDPFYFKLTNIGIHALNAVLAYVLVFQLLRITAADDAVRKSRLIAGFIALLWAVHPIQTTSVLYVVQRMTSLSATFMLIALILHIHARQNTTRTLQFWGYLLAWTVFFPLSLFSKETGILFLLYVAVYEVTLQRAGKRPSDGFGRIYPGAILATALLFLVYIFFISGEFLSGYSGRSFSMGERLMTEARVLMRYVGQIAAPRLADFSLYHDGLEVSRTLLSPPTTIVSIVSLVALSGYAWIVRHRYPSISFAVLWFLGGHSLESTILPLELMHEHRNYVPSLGLLFLVAAALSASLRPPARHKTAVVGIAIAFLFYAGFLTSLRTQMYGNDYFRTQIEASYQPDSVRSHYEAGAALVNLYALKPTLMLEVLARKHFQRVNDLDPTYKLSLIGMLQLDCLVGKIAKHETVEELRRRLRDTRWIPADRTAVHGIAEMAKDGALCLTRTQVDDLLAAALSNPTTSVADRSTVRSDYAMYLWLKERDYLAARRVLTDSIQENHGDILNRINLIQLYRLLQDRQAASKLIADVAGRNLARRDRKVIESIQREMGERP